MKIMHPADRERVLAEDARTNETGEPFRMEYRQFAKDGSVVWVRDEAHLLRDEEGNPSYWLGIQLDVTERKKAEVALRESELRLRTVITSVPVVLFAIDLRGTITLLEGRGLEVLAGEPLLSTDEVVELLRLAGRRREEIYEVQRAIERLTPRELEVLGLFAEGLSDKEISERLNVSIGTMRNHAVNIFNKLGVHSRLQALLFAVRHGIVDVT